jgi:23S rRNA (uridine2552-2'-O)-methyltransferase
MKCKNSKNKSWQDHYTRKAKKENFPARSVYKLQEIQKKFGVIKRGNTVLDLGCSPGSWLLYAANLVGPSGHVVGIDIKPVTIKASSNVEIIESDIFSDAHDRLKSLEKKFNVVMSDMAPSTTGHKKVDAARSFELCRAALNVAGDFLYSGGVFICKIFQGEDFQEFIQNVSYQFKTRKIYKPQSCRKGSKEIYVIGLEKK